MSPFVDMGLSKTKRPEPVVDGEYLVRIEAAEIIESKNVPGQENIRIRCILPQEPASEAIFHYIPGIAPSDGEDRINNKRRMAAGILEAFGLDYDDSFNTDDLVGQEAELIVTQEEYEGRISNKLQINW